MSIALHGLVKVYGTGSSAVPALNGLDLTVADGEVCIVRGPNGSGKTTLVGILSGELEPTAGSVLVSGGGGSDPRIGVVRQFDNLAGQLTVREHFALFGSASGLEFVPRAIHHRRIARLTRGERQVVAVALAMSMEPDVLLADEPTGALPPEEAEALYDALDRQVRQRHVTVLLVTHDARAERIADRVVSLRDGRISEQWSPGAVPKQVIDARGWVRIPDELRIGLHRQVAAIRSDQGIELAGRDAEVAVLPPSPHRRQATSEPLLSLEELTCGMAGHPVPSGITHVFRRGSITAITGRSGSGKTTLLRTLAGAAAILGGRVIWPDESPRPQAAYFSVELPFALHCTLEELIPRAPVVESLELREFRARELRTLSGGQRQRAIVALALMHSSPVILLDEPTTALDEHSTGLVLDAIADSDKTFLIASHDARIGRIATDTLHLG